MRKDTAILVPELEGESKETLQSLIEFGNTKKEIELVEEHKGRSMKLIESVSDEYDVILANCEAAGYDLKSIETLTDEQVLALYKREDGEEIPFHVPSDSTRQLIDMKRDFISMIFNSKENMAKIDESLEELYKMQNEYQEEVANVFAEFNGDITEYSRTQLTAQLETIDPESETAKGIKTVLAAIDDALDLNPLYETFSKLDVRNTINDFFRHSQNLALQFMRVTKANGLALDFSKFDLLEARFLDPKYHTYRNMFVFTLVKKYAKKKTLSRADAIFLTQLIVNIQVLLYEDMRNPGKLSEAQQAKRERLIAGIERVLELFAPYAPAVEPVQESEIAADAE